MTDRLMTALAVLALAAGCASDNDGDRNAGDAVPRPPAYPRLALPPADTMARVADSVPFAVEVNPSATLTVTPASAATPAAITADYPASAGASVYYTLIPVSSPDEFQRVIDARQERISLNLNGAPAATAHATRGDTTAVIVTALTGSQTPVQMLADIGGRWVLSATAFVHDPAAAARYDSISPLYDYLRRDLERALPGLNYQPRQ